MPELTTTMPGSAETWRDGPPPPRFPGSLIPSRTGTVTERLAEWRDRHLLREQRAVDFFASAMNPERGLPVATARTVIAFLRELVASRRGMLVALLVLNGLAAVAGLVVPKLLGRVVDDAAAPGTVTSTLDSLALAVGGLVVLQAVLTFLARWAASVFGQDILASAREYVVRTVLGLPLGRVESASSGGKEEQSYSGSSENHAS